MKKSRAELMAECKKANPAWSEDQHKEWVDKKMSSADDVEEMSKHSNSIRGVEIFASGMHNGDAYTEQDIDDMIAAHAELDFRPAVKIGHAKDAPGAPAYGWVTGLRKVGGKLVADFESMHDSVIQALRDRRYDRVSSEVYFNLKRGGKTFRRALKAVALLGADVPAVAGLVPLHKMEFAEDGFDSVAACEQALDAAEAAETSVLEREIIELEARITKFDAAFTKLSQKEHDAMTIKQLQDKKVALEAQLKALERNADNEARIAELTEQVAAFGAQITAAETSEATAAENAALKTRLATLEEESRARKVADAVAKCKVPAFAADLEAIYAHAMTSPEAKVKSFALKDGKRVESERTLAEVADSMVAAINAGAKQLFTVVTGGGTSGRAEGPADDASLDLDAKAKARIRDGKSKNYEEAMDAVLADDKDLAARYHEQQSARTSR